jgi:hypothetical protein
VVTQFADLPLGILKKPKSLKGSLNLASKGQSFIFMNSGGGIADQGTAIGCRGVNQSQPSVVWSISVFQLVTGR